MGHRCRLRINPVWLAVAALWAATASGQAKPPRAALGEDYVLMVSSMHPPFLKLNEQHIQALNATPFDGVAVDIINAYDGSPLPDEAALLKHCKDVRRLSKKAIWPRIYSNRMVTLSDRIKALKANRNPSYFIRIKGVDIFDEAGALGDFCGLYRLSLKMARALGAPGIVLDMEVYNHSDAYRVDWIAQQQGKTFAEIEAALRAMGSRMADITAEEFPEAVIWSLFTCLNRPVQRGKTAEKRYLAPSYVFMGMLQRAAERDVPLLLVSGGEWGGYYYESPKAMRKRFEERNAGFRPWLEKYPRRLALAATITVWGDARNNSGWVLKRATPDTPYRHVSDFEPLLAEMFRTYRYMWFYVPGVTDYRPLDADKARETNRQIEELLRRTRPSAAGG